MFQPLDLVRSVDIEPGDGRTVEGVAYRYDSPSMVRDPGSAPYLEEFSRIAHDKTVRQRPSVPLLVLHDERTRLPVGVATFSDGGDHLRFSARISETRDGDEALALIGDGALRSVSVRFRSLGSRFRQAVQGRVTTRTEIALRELSLVPTGFGAHPGAEVLAVRHQLDDTPRLDALRKRRRLLVMP